MLVAVCDVLRLGCPGQRASSHLLRKTRPCRQLLPTRHAAPAAAAGAAAWRPTAACGGRGLNRGPSRWRPRHCGLRLPAGSVGAPRTPRRSCSTASSPASCGRMCMRRRCVGPVHTPPPAHARSHPPAHPHACLRAPHTREEASERGSCFLHACLCPLSSEGPGSPRPWPMLVGWPAGSGRLSLGLLGACPQACFHPVSSPPLPCRPRMAGWAFVPVRQGSPTLLRSSQGPAASWACPPRALVPAPTQDTPC